jgi:hypothetical protein
MQPTSINKDKVYFPRLITAHFPQLITAHFLQLITVHFPRLIFGPEGQPDISRGRKPPVSVPPRHAPEGRQRFRRIPFRPFRPFRPLSPFLPQTPTYPNAPLFNTPTNGKFLYRS